MERCPHCGTPGRPGAKFCTTCGARFSEQDEEQAPATVLDGGASEATASPDQPDDAGGAPASGWTGGPTENGNPPPSAWEPPRQPEADPAAAQHDEIVDIVAGAWPAAPAASWPEPFPLDRGEDDAGTAVAPPDEALPAEPGVDDPEESAPAAAGAKDRANALLDQLRETIALFDGGEARDLGDVVAELEVAVTPPGAMRPEDLAELREALLAARDRPRDIDTMVDLSRRLGALVALAFAYERAQAAIERALDILREP